MKTLKLDLRLMVGHFVVIVILVLVLVVVVEMRLLLESSVGFIVLRF